MSLLAVLNPTLLPLSSREAGGNTQPAPSLGARIKNALFGRICTDWKNSILVAGVVFWVTKAALSFFTGYWMMAIVELFTGGFLAMIRKDYREFTNLHAATGDYRRENDQFRLSNLQLRQTTAAFKAEVGHLAQEREKIGAENQKYAASNTTYRKHLGTMKATLDRAIGEIDGASRRGEKVSTKVLKEAMKSFAAQKEMLKTMEQELSAKKDAALKRWGELVEQVGQMKAHGVDALRDADTQLQATLREIERHGATKEALEGQVSKLRGEVEHLEQTRKDLDASQAGIAAATRLNLESAGQLNRATAAMNFFFKGIFGSGDQEAVEKSRALLFGVVAVGFVGYKLLQTSGAA